MSFHGIGSFQTTLLDIRVECSVPPGRPQPWRRPTDLIFCLQARSDTTVNTWQITSRQHSRHPLHMQCYSVHHPSRPTSQYAHVKIQSLVAMTSAQLERNKTE